MGSNEISLLELKKPPGRYHQVVERTKPTSRAIEIKAILDNKYLRQVVTIVCHRNEKEAFEHEEWLLSMDGDVYCHSYYLVDDYIYSIVTVG